MMSLCVVVALMFVSVPVQAADNTTESGQVAVSDHGISLEAMGLASLDVDSDSARLVRGSGISLFSWTSFAINFAHSLPSPGLWAIGFSSASSF